MMTAAMAILAAGCAKEIDIVNPAGEDVVFEASLSETEADAKAAINFLQRLYSFLARPPQR